MRINLQPDSGLSTIVSAKVTLQATPGNITTVPIPDWARGAVINPASNEVRFAINEDPEAVGTSSSATVLSSSFKKGATLAADTASIRLFTPGVSRTLRLRSLTASVVVYVEFFGESDSH